MTSRLSELEKAMVRIEGSHGYKVDLLLMLREVDTVSSTITLSQKSKYNFQWPIVKMLI
jgi:hypothetical protein